MPKMGIAAFKIVLQNFIKKNDVGQPPGLIDRQPASGRSTVRGDNDAVTGRIPEARTLSQWPDVQDGKPTSKPKY